MERPDMLARCRFRQRDKLSDWKSPVAAVVALMDADQHAFGFLAAGLASAIS
ncbi:MAG: hypothetical protein NT090_13250 [Acidobacteria bacterium]|nr:hypothetical protein [Acidobacteriota bacterium]